MGDSLDEWTYIRSGKMVAGGTMAEGGTMAVESTEVILAS